MDFIYTLYPHLKHSAAIATHRSLVLGIMVPSSLIRSLMLNLLLLSTTEEGGRDTVKNVMKIRENQIKGMKEKGKQQLVQGRLQPLEQQNHVSENINTNSESNKETV